MDNMQPLTEREIVLVEELGILKRVHEINNLIFTCLAVRLGGDVQLENDELEYARKSYELTIDMSVSDCAKAVRLRVRLK